MEPTPFIELRQQLEALVSSLAIVQGLVEQLTVRQEQMTQEIAVLRAAEQNVSQQISLIPSPWPRVLERIESRQRTVIRRPKEGAGLVDNTVLLIALMWSLWELGAGLGGDWGRV